MGTTVAIARIMLRRGWRSLVPIALLVAAVSAIVLWTVATARRTDTAFDRMLEATDAFDVLVNPDNGSATQLTTRDLLRVDGVTDASRIEALVAFAPDASSMDDFMQFPGTLFASDGGSGWRLARPIMAEGRFPDPDRADELFVDADLAQLLDVRAGDVLPLRVVTAEGGLSLLALEEAAYGGVDDPEDLDAASRALFADPAFAPVVEFDVTGVGRLPDLVVVDSGFELPSAIATPALYEELGEPALFFGGWHVALDDPARIDEFRDAVDAIVPDESIVYQTMASVESKAERATSTPGGVMAIFAVLVLVLGLLLVGQSVQRWVGSDVSEMRILWSFGASRTELWGAASIRVAVAVAAGFALGAALAVAGSSLAPVGRARLVEVDPGLHVDVVVLGAGSAIAAILVAICAVPVWRAVGRLGDRPGERRGSTVARWVDRAGAPLPMATGVRFALDPVSGGRSSSRLAIVGALTGIAVAVAALVFTASIERVTSTPRLYGTDWSAMISYQGPQPDPSEALALIETTLETVAGDPSVRRASVLHAGELSIGGSRVPVVAYRDSDSPIARTIAEGRAPTAADEIALGRTTLDALGVALGDTLVVESPDAVLDVTVVGRAVLPAIGSYSGAEKTAMGEGAIVDPELLDPLRSFAAIAVDLVPDADLAGLERRLDEAYPVLDPVVEAYGEPAEVDSLRDLAAFPRWLATALVGLVAIPVVHSLLGSVRGRRRDLAVMSALGARPRLLRSIGCFQGLTVVLAGAVVGVPLGVAIGRVGWSGLAESFGTIAEPVVPVLAVGLLAVAVLAVGALVGGAPTWRTDRRAILRSLRPE